MIYEGLGLPCIEFVADDNDVDDEYRAYLATFKGSLLFTLQVHQGALHLPLAYHRDK